MPNSVLQQFNFVSGLRLISGGDLIQLVNLLYFTESGLTAGAGGTQALALPLPAVSVAEISTVASANDSILLPPAVIGLEVTLINDGANSMQVFGVPSNPNNAGAGDTIAAANSTAQQATATGVAHASAASFTYICFAAGKWKQR